MTPAQRLVRAGTNLRKAAKAASPALFLHGKDSGHPAIARRENARLEGLAIANRIRHAAKEWNAAVKGMNGAESK